MGGINVLKIGGGAGVDQTAVLQNLAERVQNGEQWVLVHGASDTTNRLAEEYGHPVQTITSPGGHVSRYNDARTIEIFTIACGLMNQGMVDELTSYRVNAAGLISQRVIHAERKTAIRAVRNGRPVVIRDDYSGRITGVDADAIRAALADGVLPIVPPLAQGLEGEDLNVDGDLVAATIARELGAENLIILSNVPGLLRDVDNPNSLIEEFGLHALADYEHFAQGRMKKKLLAAREADVQRVILADSRLENPLDAALSGGGTHIVRDAVYA